MSRTETSPGLRVGIERGPRGDTRVRLVGELDIASLGGVRALLLAVLEDCAHVVPVDLRGLRFVDLPGVRMLAELSLARECALELVGASCQVAQLIELTRVRLRLA